MLRINTYVWTWDQAGIWQLRRKENWSQNWERTTAWPRECFCVSFSVIPPIYPFFTNCKLIDNELWLDGNFAPQQA